MTALPPSMAAWVAGHLGGDVEHVSVLTGGLSSQMDVVRSSSGAEAVLRRMTIQPWKQFAQGLLNREYAVQSMLANAAVPVPDPIAVDADGKESGEPSLLMTRLPGRVDLVRHDEAYLERLASMLLRIHRFRPEREWPREYQSWAFESKFEVPPWSTDDGLYKQAFEVLREPAPSYAPTFIHRDFHPINVLWLDGEITGVVDWVETSTGPVDLDVAHCASNLATLHGVERAVAFREAYAASGGFLEGDPDANRYWQLMDLAGFLPEPSGRESGATGTTMTDVWRANGRPDLTVELARSRREDLLRTILSGSRT